MENLEPAILNFMHRESNNFGSVISLEVISEKYGVDLRKLLHYADDLEGQGIVQRQRTSDGRPKSILYDIRRKNNDPRAPKGSECLYTVNRKKLKELIDKIKSS